MVSLPNVRYQNSIRSYADRTCPQYICPICSVRGVRQLSTRGQVKAGLYRAYPAPYRGVMITAPCRGVPARSALDTVVTRRSTSSVSAAPSAPGGTLTPCLTICACICDIDEAFALVLLGDDRPPYLLREGSIHRQSSCPHGQEPQYTALPVLL